MDFKNRGSIGKKGAIISTKLKLSQDIAYYYYIMNNIIEQKYTLITTNKTILVI